MKPIDFLDEFGAEDFPKYYEKWIIFDAHDPPFKIEELRSMRMRGLIDLREADRTYRLTIEATQLRFGRDDDYGE